MSRVTSSSAAFRRILLASLAVVGGLTLTSSAQFMGGGQPAAPQQPAATQDFVGTFENKPAGVTLAIRKAPDGKYVGSLTVNRNGQPSKVDLINGDVEDGELAIDFQQNGQTVVLYCTFQGGYLVMTQGGDSIMLSKVAGAAPAPGPGPAPAPGPGPAPRPNPLPPGPQQPQIAPSGFAGDYTGDNLSLKLVDQPGFVGGALTINGATYPLQAGVNAGKLVGKFKVDNALFDFSATLADPTTLSLVSEGNTYTLKRPAPAPQPANPLAKKPTNPLVGNNASNAGGNPPVPNAPAANALPAELTGDFGIELDHDKKDGSVKSVKPGSPAANAGVEAGEVLMTVDNTAINGKTFNEIDAMLRGKVGSIVSVTFKKADGSNHAVSCPRERLDLCELVATQPIPGYATYVPNDGLWTMDYPSTWKGWEDDKGVFIVDAGMLGVKVTVQNLGDAGGMDSKAAHEKLTMPILNSFKSNFQEPKAVPADKIGAEAYAIRFDRLEEVGIRHEGQALTVVVKGKVLLVTISVAEYAPSSLQEVVGKMAKSFKVKNG
ncbi:MAG: PDZ domain-containing protein [Tepidisphaeraceae bacterium]